MYNIKLADSTLQQRKNFVEQWNGPDADGDFPQFKMPGVVINGPLEIGGLGSDCLVSYRELYRGPKPTKAVEKKWRADGKNLWKVLPPDTVIEVRSAT